MIKPLFNWNDSLPWGQNAFTVTADGWDWLEALIQQLDVGWLSWN